MLKRILSIRKGKFFISAAVSIILVVVLIIAAVNQLEVKAEIKNYTSEEKILEKQGKELEINNLSKENYAEEVLEPEELLNGTENKMQETTDELLVAEEKQDSPEEIQEVQEQDKQENLQNVEEVSEPSKSSDTFFIELQPQSASAEEGRNAELTCYSKSAEETGHYKWQYYDLDKSEWQDIVDSDKYSVSKAVDKEERPLSKLTIKKLKEEDEKLFYRCLVYEGQEADASSLTSAQASVKVIPSGFTHMIVSYQKSCEVGTVLRVSDLMIGLLYPDDSIQFVSGLNNCSLVKTNDENSSSSGADSYEVMLEENDLVLKYQTEKGTTIDTALTVTGIDSQKPVLTKTETTDYKPSKSAQIPVTVAVTLEGSDNYTQIGELEYALVDESEKVSDQDYSKQSVYALQLDKNTNFTAYVKDEAGNSNCKNISLYVLDETAPVIKEITLANPEEDTWWNRNQIIVDAEDDTKMLFCFTLESDSKITSGWINANVFEINQNGTYKVEVSDAAGNITSDTIEVKNVDAEAPTLEGLTAYYVPDVAGCTGQVIGFDLEGYPIYGADGSNSDIIGYNYEGKAIYYAEEKEENLFGYYLDESNLYGTLGEKVEDDTEELKTNAGGNTISGTLTKSSDTDSKKTTAASTPTNTENTDETATISTSKGSTGAEGKSGINSYVHIRYSVNSDGSDMTTAPETDTVYMGVYSGTSATAPTDAANYTWTKVLQNEKAKLVVNGCGNTSKLIGSTVTLQGSTKSYSQVFTSTLELSFYLDELGSYTLSFENVEGTESRTVNIDSYGYFEEDVVYFPGYDVWSYWCLLGGLSSRDYDSFSDLMKSDVAMSTLMTSKRAIDYMINSKTKIMPAVLSSELACDYMAQNSYATTNIVKDDDWFEAINDSEYWSVLLNQGIPSLSANSSENGEVTYSGELLYNGMDGKGYYAFDKVGSTYWAAQVADGRYTTAQTAWLQVKMPETYQIRKIQMNVKYESVTAMNRTIGIQYSLDGSTWYTLNETKTVSCPTDEKADTLIWNTDIKAKYFKLYNPKGELWSNAAGTYTGFITFNEIQLYGREAQ